MGTEARRWTSYAVALLVALIAVAGVNAAAGQRFGAYKRPKAQGPKFVPGEVLVKFKVGVAKRHIDGVRGRHGLKTLYKSRFAGFERVRIPKGKAVADAVKALRQEASVEYAEPNSICHAHADVPPPPVDDPYYYPQWHLDDHWNPNPFGGDNGGGINLEPAWLNSTKGLGVVVAVLDSGVAYENLDRRIVQAPDLAGTAFKQGYDFINNDAHANDDNSHGTHVAGTIAQTTNNGYGCAGVAYNCTIMPVKVLDRNGSGTAQTLADGICFAADNGAKVINMSLGWPPGYDPGTTVAEAVDYAYGKGVTMVCSSGNDGASVVAYPAAYDKCIAVGATRYDETVTSYSNGGSALDIVAPGGDLGVDQDGNGEPDGVLQNTFNPIRQKTWDFGFWWFDGTSMAAPHVSGVAALIIANGTTDPDAVREKLVSTAEKKGFPDWDAKYGFGIVDAAAALGIVSNQPPVAVDDSYTIDEDDILIVDGPAGVLSNDTDGDGDPLTASPLSPPANGTLLLDENGSFTYDPDPDFSGTDSFTYTVSDGNGGTDTATVTITVNPLNDAPIAEPDAYEVAMNGDLNVKVPGLKANDTDAENDPLSVVVVSGPSDGSLTVNDGALPYPLWSFRYTPGPGFFGEDTFTYKVNDGLADSAPATVTITVLADRAYRLPDGELMSGEFDQLPYYSLSDSTLDDRIDVAGQGAVYGLTLKGEDSGKIGIGELSWPVASVAGLDYDPGVPGECQPHDNSSLAAYSCYEMTVSYLAGPAGSSINVGLIMNTGLTGPSGYPSNESSNNTFWQSIWTTIPLGQTVTLLQLDFSGATAYEVNDNEVPHSEGGLESPEGGIYTINDRDRHEISNIGLQIADFDGGALLTEGYPIQIALNVTEPLLPPVATDDSDSTGEDTPVTIDVLANDSADALTVTNLTQPTHGMADLNPDNTVTYTPFAGFVGTDTFTYTANDGILDSNVATVTITVTAAVNDLPVASFSYTTNALTATFDGSASHDTDGTIESYEWDFGDENAGSGVALSHPYALAGTYTVTLTVTDDDGATDETSQGVTVTEPVEPTITVADVTVEIRRAGRNYYAVAYVTVVDDSGVPQPVEGATVTVTWSGDVDGVRTGLTDALGEAAISSPKTKTVGSGFTARVTNVVKEGAIWDGVEVEDSASP